MLFGRVSRKNMLAHPKTNPDTPVMSCFHVSARGFDDCARAVRSPVCVPCFVLERGVRIPALMSWDSVFVSGLHFLSLCECAVSSSLDYALSCPCVFCCVARSSCISLAACFHVVISCVNTWLMSFLISCVFVSCFAHGWWIVCWPCACVFVLCEHVASVLVFCVPCTLMSICLDPTHLVTCLLIHFPQLLSLVTLLICSLYNLLVFAVPCGFVAICWFIVVRLVSSPALCPVLPCVQSCLVSSPALCPVLPCVQSCLVSSPALCPVLPCAQSCLVPSPALCPVLPCAQSCLVPSPALCPVLPCVQSSQSASLFFPLWGSFCLFVLFLCKINPFSSCNWVLALIHYRYLTHSRWVWWTQGYKVPHV